MGKKSGYALLAVIFAINILAILALTARNMWETEIRRDLEEELIFRGRQYVQAILVYRQKNNNLSPKNLKILYEKKLIRKLYKDPMTESGEWEIIMQSSVPGKQELLIVPEGMVDSLIQNAIIVGVISTSPEESFMEYRKKNRYHEWAFYVGDDESKEMPPLRHVTDE